MHRTALLGLLALATAHHVLFFHNLGPRSHLIQLSPIMEQLLENGNQVTAIIFSSVDIKHNNYTEIVLRASLDEGMEKFSQMVVRRDSLLDPELWKWIYKIVTEDLKEHALDVVKHPEVQKLIQTRPRVDAVVTMWTAGTIFAEIFDCPLILFSPNSPVISKGTTNVINFSVQPFVTAPFIEPMTFLQRLSNHAMIFAARQAMSLLSSLFHSHQSSYLERELGLTVQPPDTVLRERVAVMLTCSHPLTHGAWQYLPNIIEVGGLQLRPPRKLPAHLQNFMDKATGGAMLVSFGSSLRSSHMPPEKMEMFLEVFRRLDIAVVWKWEGEIRDLPENILVSSWLPQQDLLGHPNLKVFLTHGGLGSLVEAIYHKAVIVGIPLSTDQKPNLLRAERHGYATRLDWDTFTAEELEASIRKAMGDERMRQNMDLVHRRYTDVDVRPAEKAAWWVEYVCRHQGARWLRGVEEEVPHYQSAHLDVLLVMLVLPLVLLSLLLLLLCRALRRRAARPKTD